MIIISLFSGAGGFDLGFIQAGHKVVWANDFDSDAVQTYCNNIGNHIIEEDIEKIQIDNIPDADVIIGGFPCQGFSQANLKRSIDDSRNKLYKFFVKIVKIKKPNYFLAENVRGILSIDKGNAIKTIVKDFSDLGYRVKYKLFNTADYGVPQTRQRVIIAGTNNSLSYDLDYQFPQPTHMKQPKNSNCNLFPDFDDLKPWITIQQALKDIPEPDKDGTNLPNHIYSKYKVTNRNFTGHRRTDPNKPSPTILARGNGKGGVCAIQHPKNHRRMSIRESAIIQTFPIDFHFSGNMNSCYRQVGNAVPVLFAKLLANQMKKLEERLKQ